MARRRKNYGLMTVADVAKAAGVEETSILRYKQRPRSGLPKPVPGLGRGLLFDADEIHEWVKTRNRRPGRPHGFSPKRAR
jgi:predicted DNA-binding transcriptional regulator AlpA